MNPKWVAMLIIWLPLLAFLAISIYLVRRKSSQEEKREQEEE